MVECLKFSPSLVYNKVIRSMAGNPLVGPMIEGYDVGAWCPSTDGTGKPTAVAFSLKVRGLGDMVVRLKSPRAVDELVALLQKYKGEVWPDAASDGQHRHSSG